MSRVLLIIQKLFFLPKVTFIHENGVYRLSSLILSYVKHMKLKGRYVSFFIAWSWEYEKTRQRWRIEINKRDRREESLDRHRSQGARKE